MDFFMILPWCLTTPGHGVLSLYMEKSHVNVLQSISNESHMNFE